MLTDEQLADAEESITKYPQQAAYRLAGLMEREKRHTTTPMKIESNIPLPTVNSNEDGPTATLRLMKVGDSVVVEHKSTASWYPIAYKLGLAIAARRIKGTYQSRVWRTA